VRRAEGNSLAKSIPVALCTLGPNIGFGLPVHRYRARVHAIPAAGLAARPYFHRYSDDAIDLCDVLSSFSSQAKVSLHELCKVMGLPGKPNGIGGADVEPYHGKDGSERFILVVLPDVRRDLRARPGCYSFDGTLNTALRGSRLPQNILKWSPHTRVIFQPLSLV
jgi:hypothetical protein